MPVVSQYIAVELHLGPVFCFESMYTSTIYPVSLQAQNAINITADFEYCNDFSIGVMTALIEYFDLDNQICI